MLSVIVLTLNEEKNIAACLDSARSFADELIVFDSFSHDRTVEIARGLGAITFQYQFENYPAQRNAAMEAARGDWIFFLDADERATPRVGAEVGTEIARAAIEPNPPTLFWIPRKNYIFGKWIQHTGWSPDYQPRVLRKGAARFDPMRAVHELVITSGPERFLQEPLVHFNYDSLPQFRAKQNIYTRFEAQVLYEQGVRAKWRGYLGQPLREFARRLISLEGYKDGAHGFALSVLMAYYAFVRQQMLGEMWANEQRR